jgi:hypothetical protein
MGWAAPIDWVEPRNVGLGQSRPNRFFLLFGAGPSLAHIVGLGQKWADPMFTT